jgi:hypothetical protein
MCRRVTRVRPESPVGVSLGRARVMAGSPDRNALKIKDSPPPSTVPASVGSSKHLGIRMDAISTVAPGGLHRLVPLLTSTRINAQRAGDIHFFVIRPFVHSEDTVLEGSWRQVALNEPFDRGMRRPYFLLNAGLSPTARSERVIHLTDHSRSRLPRAATLLLGALVLLLTLTGGLTSGPASASSSNLAVNHHSATTPNGDSGTSIDPLRYNCGNAAPSCGQVGESFGFYNGTNVNLLYSENYYCDTAVASNATTGCEVGAPPSSANPTAPSSNGTSLGNTTHGDTLYIPVPLFAGAPPTQCVGTATCIDHPPTIDLSRIASALPGNPSPASLNNVAIPSHNHVVATRNSSLPEWWKVQVVATTDPATFATLTSVSAINAAVTANKAITAPTNAYLFFQVLPGTVPAAVAANLTATAPPGPAVSAAPAGPPASQVEPGTTFDNLLNDCGATAPNCQNVGQTHDWIQGQDVQSLYSESFYCGTTASTVHSATGCEAGANPTSVPPGVSDPTPPTPTVTNNQIDPLYIPVPLYSSPPVAYAQCPGVITCIDHPATIDLSLLAPTLGVADASSLNNVPLPSHDHLLTTRNGDQPEWWNVIVIPVTSAQGLASVEHAKDYTSVKALETVAGSGVGVTGAPEVPTNAYLWFQTLPGAGSATPGPVTSTCTSHLPSGSVVGGAALDDGTGYYQVDAAGDVAAFGAATCYGSMTGAHLHQPIVGMAVDRTTGGYWLVAADGGVFAFNAPFLGSTGGIHLNRPVVGMTPTLDGSGYRLVASDGGVFSYNADFLGSTGGIHLNEPIVGLSIDRMTGGYWLVAADGGVFSYGAPFLGSTGGITLNKPVVGIMPTSDGSGYRLAASDGGVFSFGAPFYGSAGNIKLSRPIVGGFNNNSYDGYWLVASDGGVFTYGSPGDGMPFFGSAV